MVFTLTEDGVIAPRVKVREGLPVGSLTVALTPLAVVTPTFETVPVATA